MAELINEVAELAAEKIKLQKNSATTQELDRRLDALFEGLVFGGESFHPEERKRIVSEVTRGCEQMLHDLPAQFAECHSGQALGTTGRIFLYEDGLAEWLISFEGGSLGVIDPARADRLQSLCQAATTSWIEATRRIIISSP